MTTAQQSFEAAIELATLGYGMDAPRIADSVGRMTERELRDALVDVSCFTGLLLRLADDLDGSGGALLRHAAAAYTAELTANP